MDQQEFVQQLAVIQQHPAHSGNVFKTANIIDQLTNSTHANYVISCGVAQGWLADEEAAE